MKKLFLVLVLVSFGFGANSEETKKFIEESSDLLFKRNMYHLIGDSEPDDYLLAVDFMQGVTMCYMSKHIDRNAINVKNLELTPQEITRNVSHYNWAVKMRGKYDISKMSDKEKLIVLGYLLGALKYKDKWVESGENVIKCIGNHYNAKELGNVDGYINAITSIKLRYLYYMEAVTNIKMEEGLDEYAIKMYLQFHNIKFD